MIPADTQRQKSSVKTTGLIIVAAVSVLIAAGALWNNDLSGTRQSQMNELSGRLAEVQEVLRNQVTLQGHFQQLQELDEKYNHLLMNSPTAAQLDSANVTINSHEKALRQTLDSLGNQTNKYKAWGNVMLADSMVASFKKALSNRRYLASVRGLIEGKPIAIASDDKERLQMQFDIEKKDERIADLEKQLKSNRPAGTTPPPAAAAAAPTVAEAKPTAAAKELQKQKDQLAASLKEEEMRNTGLLDLTRTLKADNEKLLAELNKARRSNAGDDAASIATKTKLTSLQDQVDDLNAQLSFSGVDCNLTRADAKKIISNSRQRRELLAQALQSLQSLARSDNTAIQKRAKEKLAELNQIASTVRD